jgi:hypothetical protein
LSVTGGRLTGNGGSFQRNTQLTTLHIYHALNKKGNEIVKKCQGKKIGVRQYSLWVTFEYPLQPPVFRNKYQMHMEDKDAMAAFVQSIDIAVIILYTFTLW